MAEKIYVTYEQYGNYCGNADKIPYQCPKWPAKEDIRDKILPNLDTMLPFLVWVLETTPEPKTQEEKEVKEMLESIQKEFYEFVDEIPENHKNKSVSGLPIKMTYDEYEAMCEAASASGTKIRKWPTVDQVKKYGLSKFKEKLPWYIKVIETAPDPSTPEEKACWHYINKLILANVQFTDE